VAKGASGRACRVQNLQKQGINVGRVMQIQFPPIDSRHYLKVDTGLFQFRSDV
jgi:hypothetical protein